MGIPRRVAAGPPAVRYPPPPHARPSGRSAPVTGSSHQGERVFETGLGPGSGSGRNPTAGGAAAAAASAPAQLLT